jgi:hypothetical protein
MVVQIGGASRAMKSSLSDISYLLGKQSKRTTLTWRGAPNNFDSQTSQGDNATTTIRRKLDFTCILLQLAPPPISEIDCGRRHERRKNIWPAKRVPKAGLARSGAEIAHSQESLQEKTLTPQRRRYRHAQVINHVWVTYRTV